MSRFEEVRKKRQIRAANAAVEIVRQYQDGLPPSNDQIIKVIDSTEAALDESKKNPAANEKGRNIIRDSESLLDAARSLLEKRNSDETLQQLVVNVQQATNNTELSLDQLGPIGERQKNKLEALRKQMNEIALYGKTSLEHIIRSSEFRSLLSEVFDLFRLVYVKVVEKDVLAAENPVEAIQESANEMAEDEDAIKSQKTVYKRFKSLLGKISNSPEHQHAVDALFGLIDRLEVEAEDEAEDVKETIRLNLDENAMNAAQDVKKIIEEFAGPHCIDDIMDELKQLLLTLKTDKDLVSYFIEVKESIYDGLKQPDILDEDEYTEKVMSLIKQGKDVFDDDMYQESATKLLKKWHLVFDNFKQNDEINAFQLAFKKLVSDISTTDENGAYQLDHQAFEQIRILIIPIMIEQLKYIPIEEVCGSNEVYDFRIQNVVLSGYDIFPNNIKVQSKFDVDLALRGSKPSTSNGSIIISTENIRTKLRNVRFYYRRKSFPQIEDDGFADLDIGGRGLKMKIKLSISGVGSSIRVDDCYVWTHIDKLELDVHHSNHDILYRLLRSTIAHNVKSVLEKTIGDSLAQSVGSIKERINMMLYQASLEKTWAESLSKKFSTFMK